MHEKTTFSPLKVTFRIVKTTFSSLKVTFRIVKVILSSLKVNFSRLKVTFTYIYIVVICRNYPTLPALPTPTGIPLSI